MSVLAERLVAVHEALAASALRHAFGGAIALAYCTEEPRGTRDIDVNVFVDLGAVDDVLLALPPEVSRPGAAVAQLRRDGQARLWWDDTPVDLFLDVHEFHLQVPLGVREVPFAGTTIPVLGCTDLVVFKVMFGRTKDWADIEEMVAAGAVDGAIALGWIAQLLGPDDPALRRLHGLLLDGQR